MNPVILFEDEGCGGLLPLVYWRSAFELQTGRKTQLDRLAQRLKQPISGVWTREWLAAVAGQRCGAPCNRPATASSVLVNGRWLVDRPTTLPPPPCVGVLDDGAVAFVACDESLARTASAAVMLDASRRDVLLQGVPRKTVQGRLLNHAWDLTEHLAGLLEQDWEAADSGFESPVDERSLSGPREQFHVGEGTRIHRTALLDASSGPIYISHDVAVGPNAVLEGPLYVGPGTKLNPHAWIHGGNIIGPVCKIGGEVHGCVLHAYVNKQHHGFLGHSVVGSWVNIGAGATNSDLKNTYGSVRVPLGGVETETGLQFFGAIIGDHAKIGINAAIPTGAVIGMGATLSGTRVVPKFVPSFAWVTDDGIKNGDPLKCLDVATAVMARRNVEMTDQEVELFLELGQRVRQYEMSSPDR